MSTVSTYHIHLSGIVQGIGFRPYVVQLAHQFGLNGWVTNSTNGVHIELNAHEDVAQNFYFEILTTPPPLAHIIQHSISKVHPKEFHTFQILDSKDGDTPDILITPDYALCSYCTEELDDVKNKRFQYPFITCTQCGPRYSIISQLPYDRKNTTMQDFVMCQSCKSEYENIGNRRFYSQTNSCPDCGIRLQLSPILSGHTSLNHMEILKTVQMYLADGKIVAVKGVGGYVVLCDATNAASIKLLRQRKHRPAKPFAVLYKDIQQMEEYTDMTTTEKTCLLSSVAPIALLRSKPNTTLALHEIAPLLNTIGCMLPNSPLLYLIASAFAKPLICTSANMNDGSIIFNDERALQCLPIIAHAIVLHNRSIVVPQDDSVVLFTKTSQRQIIIRRARGLAPLYLGYAQKQNATVLATGALMKSSFTIQTNNKTYISQFLGNTDSLDAQQSYMTTWTHLQEMLQVQPQVIITDKHPNYFATQWAHQFSIKENIPMLKVQHHKAHFAAVLAENNLLYHSEPVLGVIWDGTGLGDDQHIWGGEFFKFENREIQRLYSFDAFPQLLNDKMAKEPRLSALSICHEIMGSDELLQHKFTQTEWMMYKKILHNVPVITCCSMGRIFDAVASLLDVCDTQSYEGEAALYLQTLAESYIYKNGFSPQESYCMNIAHLHRIPTATLFHGIISDILKKKDFSYIAAKFHFSLVHIVKIVAQHVGTSKIAFSGGVFQNSLLVDMLFYDLKTNHQLFFHQRLSPNDENISFGQMVYYDQNIDNIQQQESHNNHKKLQICV